MNEPHIYYNALVPVTIGIVARALSPIVVDPGVPFRHPPSDKHRDGCLDRRDPGPVVAVIPTEGN